MSSALVVLSGGQDSTTCLFWAAQRFHDVYAITFDYNQRHRREIEAAETVARMAHVRWHEVVRVPDILTSTSPLTATHAELEKYDSFEQMDKIIGDRVELTFVPMRNTLFLTIAANRAVALRCDSIVTGICQEDNANYPDCREPFRQALELAFRASLGTDCWLKIEAPLMFLSKAETVQLAYDLPGCWEALAYTHTSYDGKYPPTDPNHANILRAHGFKKAKLPDPLVLRAHKEGLMQLPPSENYDSERDEEDLQRVIAQRHAAAMRELGEKG